MKFDYEKPRMELIDLLSENTILTSGGSGGGEGGTPTPRPTRAPVCNIDFCIDFTGGGNYPCWLNG